MKFFKLPQYKRLPAMWEDEGKAFIAAEKERIERELDRRIAAGRRDEEEVQEAIRAAVLAERERCAKIAESDAFYGSAAQHAIAAAIRKGEMP